MTVLFLKSWFLQRRLSSVQRYSQRSFAFIAPGLELGGSILAADWPPFDLLVNGKGASALAAIYET